MSSSGNLQSVGEDVVVAVSSSSMATDGATLSWKARNPLVAPQVSAHSLRTLSLRLLRESARPAHAL